MGGEPVDWRAVAPVSVDGVDIAADTSPGNRLTVVLIHGIGAHRRWWDRAAAAMSPGLQLVRVDLSGHGDSGWRERYDRRTWGTEVAAVIARSADVEHPTVVLGHSVGGLVALMVAAMLPERVAGVGIVDTAISERRRASSPGVRRSPQQHRLYHSLDEAMHRFRLLPEQPILNPSAVHHVARHSYREVEDGWTLKSDHRVFDHFDSGSVTDDLAALRCPGFLVYGAQSPFWNRENHAQFEQAFGADLPITTIEQANHHVLLDQPERCAAALLDGIARITGGEVGASPITRI